MSTAIYSIVAPAVAVIVGSVVGFAIVALRLRARLRLVRGDLSSTVIPVQMILMPLFRGYVKCGMYSSRAGMIVVYTVLTIPFAAFVMRIFFSPVSPGRSSKGPASTEPVWPRSSPGGICRCR